MLWCYVSIVRVIGLRSTNSLRILSMGNLIEKPVVIR